MAITHSTALRNIIADAVDTEINGGAGTEGDLHIKAGGVTIAIINFQDPAFGAAAAAVITAAGVPLTANATATGVVDGFELRNKANVVVITGTITVTAGGGDIEIDNTSVNSGQEVRLTSLTYTAPV